MGTSALLTTSASTNGAIAETLFIGSAFNHSSKEVQLAYELSSLRSGLVAGTGISQKDLEQKQSEITENHENLAYDAFFMAIPHLAKGGTLPASLEKKIETLSQQFKVKPDQIKAGAKLLAHLCGMADIRCGAMMAVFKGRSKAEQEDLLRSPEKLKDFSKQFKVDAESNKIAPLKNENKQGMTEKAAEITKTENLTPERQKLANDYFDSLTGEKTKAFDNSWKELSKNLSTDAEKNKLKNILYNVHDLSKTGSKSKDAQLSELRKILESKYKIAKPTATKLVQFLAKNGILGSDDLNKKTVDNAWTKFLFIEMVGNFTGVPIRLMKLHNDTKSLVFLDVGNELSKLVLEPVG